MINHFSPSIHRLFMRIAGWISLRVDFSWLLMAWIFWLWFAWQHGFQNSPDSWYRGILAKSIAEGHFYWINMKQGWLYEFQPWNHSAAHSPLLPVIYALFFYLFGPSISVSNMVVASAAGLSIYPILKLSRGLTGGILAGLCIYFWISFNAHNDFLFEIFAGLSIPVAVTTVAYALFGLWLVLTRDEHRYVLLCALALAAFFYVRSGEQWIFIGFMVTSLSMGYFMLSSHIYRRLIVLWIYAVALVTPWAIRNYKLFGDPLFTHMTPALWTDRAYDYWDYHEQTPLPTAAGYWMTHTFGDLITKIIYISKNYFTILNQSVDGFLILYAILVLTGLILIAGIANRNKQFFLIMVFMLFLGYSFLHCLLPLIDKRYMVMPSLFGIMFIVLSFSTQNHRFIFARWVVAVFVCLLFAKSQWSFWGNAFFDNLLFAYTTSDQKLTEDETVQALRRSYSHKDVFMGPIGEVQRLNFATGITFVEAPNNIEKMDDVSTFFRRYGIRYSLMDVTHILPDHRIKNIFLVGNQPVYEIDLESHGAHHALSNSVDHMGMDAAPERSFRKIAGKEKTLLIDQYHGGPIPWDVLLKEANDRVMIKTGPLSTYAEDLMRARIFIIRYEMHRPEFSEEDLAIMDRYIDKGGAVFLLCPAWVPASYEKKSLDRLGFNRIASRFGMLLNGDSVPAPFLLGPLFGRGPIPLSAPVQGAAFSHVLGRTTMIPVITDAQGKSVAAAAQGKGGARILIWGHNNLFDQDFSNTQEGKQMLQQMMHWLAG
ncbi:MAG: hypothetical protein HQL88_03300, partial [Magnetococcales bacterium]|nr:hypothetical protein [Magnetococcales bacterium]